MPFYDYVLLYEVCHMLWHFLWPTDILYGSSYYGMSWKKPYKNEKTYVKESFTTCDARPLSNVADQPYISLSSQQNKHKIWTENLENRYTAQTIFYLVQGLNLFHYSTYTHTSAYMNSY